jgi:hypothetical protein
MPVGGAADDMLSSDRSLAVFSLLITGNIHNLGPAVLVPSRLAPLTRNGLLRSKLMCAT